MFYQDTKQIKKNNNITFGVNHGLCNGSCSIHAELDAINKLKPLKNKKRLKSINLLVVRLNMSKQVIMSKPCQRCIMMLETFPMTKGYKVNKIYYSDDNGNIIRTNIQKLKREKNHICSFDRYIRKLEI